MEAVEEKEFKKKLPTMTANSFKRKQELIAKMQSEIARLRLEELQSKVKSETVIKYCDSNAENDNSTADDTDSKSDINNKEYLIQFSDLEPGKSDISNANVLESQSISEGPFQPISIETDLKPEQGTYQQLEITYTDLKEDDLKPVDSSLNVKQDDSCLKSDEDVNINDVAEKLESLAQKNVAISLFSCGFCDETFSQPQALGEHVKWHKISMCKSRKELKAQLKKEKKKKKEIKKVLETVDLEASDGKPYLCGLCNKGFAVNYDLRIHIRSHTGEKPYQCKHCPKRFITASKLKRHSEVHSENKEFVCRVCFRDFGRMITLKRHFDSKHAADKLECEPYSFKNIADDYAKLLAEQHAGDGDLVIPEKVLVKNEVNEPKCELVVVKKEVIKDEEQYDYPMSPECLESPEFFAQFESMPDCKQEMIEGDVPKLETIKKEVKKPPKKRGRKPKGKPNSKKETTKKDKKVKKEIVEPTAETHPYQCIKCKKRFKTLSYIKIHMRLHTGERPYRCYICDKGFITASKMQRHILVHISAEWRKKKQRDEEAAAGAEEKKTEQGSEDKKPEQSSEEKPQSEEVPITKESLHDGQLIESFIRSKLKDVDEDRIREEIQSILIMHNKNIKNSILFTKGTKKRKYECLVCHKKYLHEFSLTCHLQTHNDDGFTCDVCGCQLSSWADLSTHLASHGASPYSCDVCSKCFIDKPRLRQHLYIHRDKQNDPLFQCEFCEKNFNAMCKLKRHLLTHRPDKFITRYECPVCAHMFTTKYHIEKHLTTHEKEGLIFSENRGEVLAMAMHNARRIPIENTNIYTPELPLDLEPKLYSCDVCGDTFSRYLSLTDHQKIHLSFDEKSPIPLSSLQIAKTEQREPEKPEVRNYKCTYCDKRFKLHYYLKLHLRTHTNERPFSCPQCGRGFITSGKLKRHIISHSGVKNYQCPTCSKCFSTQSYLRIHMKVHNSYL